MGQLFMGRETPPSAERAILEAWCLQHTVWGPPWCVPMYSIQLFSKNILRYASESLPGKALGAREIATGLHSSSSLTASQGKWSHKQ